MEKLTVDVCIKTKEDSVNQAPKDEMDVQALNDTELREQLSVYGINAGPILPSTRAVYENKLLKLMKQGPTIAFGEKSRLDDSENKNGEQGQTTEVVLETNNLRVTAECASGLDNKSAAEVAQRQKKLLSSDIEHSLAKIVSELQEILPEGKVALNRSQGLRRKVGSSPERNYKQKINDTRHIDYGYPDANSVGVSTRRRPVQVNPPSVKQVSERKSRVMSEKPEEELIPTRVKIAVLAIFIFLLFVYVTMETNVANPFSRFIMGK
ncbi:LEM domain-containing protein 1 isoform X1 [Sceloporus undulatus]|uniref:LEM domain-containing protein 1 isoform X1 n=1 Tax=Sceloporus undulatus TaxID=8520 RepID=UPI001C4D82D1|nr:LEM domain-containing protein 1 isoform X1 [Sceloporus undulatus]XP_042322196.1 LEM domain-containing protein 1 isoform X1 [Sceloporus undulatus]XP_042322197.1 LEM domain-containing protein 1 isoform X1 [Sceloporus undulatus]XP_042322198.1 LEM domain-containing protein 1 isoform X1 [Sceloporus undulatus]XP_042322199.1 LEM domain-containing protein 1 isoform X1 [Sceloporus undulatus]